MNLEQQRSIMAPALRKARRSLWPYWRTFTFPIPEHGAAFPRSPVSITVRLTEDEEQQFLAGTLSRTRVRQIEAQARKSS